MTDRPETATRRAETPIGKQYATGIAPRCIHCGAEVPKADVVWGSTAGAWHKQCALRIALADGTHITVSR